MKCGHPSSFLFEVPVNTLWATCTLSENNWCSVQLRKMTNLRFSSQVKLQKDPTCKLKKQHCSQVEWVMLIFGQEVSESWCLKLVWQWSQWEQITGYLLTQCLQSASIVLFLQEYCGWRGAAVCAWKHISLAAQGLIHPLNLWSRPSSDGSFTQVWSTWLF